MLESWWESIETAAEDKACGEEREAGGRRENQKQVDSSSKKAYWEQKKIDKIDSSRWFYQMQRRKRKERDLNCHQDQIILDSFHIIGKGGCRLSNLSYNL